MKRPKTLFDRRPTVAWPLTTVAWPFSDFKKFLIAWIVEKSFFDSWPSTVAWPPTTVAWPFSDFFPKIRVTSDHCRVTVQWLFSKIFLIAWNVQKRCLTVGRRSRDLRPLSRDRSVTFYENCLNCFETSKNDVWQSVNGRVTSDHCRVTVQWLFSKQFPNCLKRPKTLFDSRPTVAWPPTTVAWPFSDFFQKVYLIAWNVQKRCLTVGRRSRDLRPLSRDRSVTLIIRFHNCLKRPKTLFDSRPTVAWPPTTVAWPFSDFFQNLSELLEPSKKRCLL